MLLFPGEAEIQTRLRYGWWSIAYVCLCLAVAVPLAIVEVVTGAHLDAYGWAITLAMPVGTLAIQWRGFRVARRERALEALARLPE